MNSAQSQSQDGGLVAVSLHDGDDVAVIIGDGQRGQAVQARLVDGTMVRLTLGDAVPFGHKIALRDIAAGDEVRKYGVPIGRATQAIAAGAHVHVHNLIGVKVELAGGPQA